jgi:hypothetical protein
MIVKDQRANSAARSGALLVLVAGLLGAWLLSQRAAPSTSQTPLSGPFAADAGVAPSPDLTTLAIEIAPEHAAVLQAARDHALAQGVILDETGAEVPVRARLGDEEVAARARIKGDWTDHIDTDKWSLRIEVDSTPLRGMTRFSVQHPKTRGWLMEWVMFEIARAQGLIAPRCDFVQVSINGRNSGVYFLEEHFTKELLESQGRRDGPIVRFDEDTLWRTWLQHDFRKRERLPLPVTFAATEHAAAVAAFNERRFAGIANLNNRLHRALQMMRDLQLASLTDQPYERLAKLQALIDLQGRTVDDLFVADKLARMLALYSLVPADHGLAWHTLRFYHDPVLDRLEPILFNTGANLELPPRELAVLVPQLAELARSNAVYEGTFRELGRISQPDFVDALRGRLGPDLERFARALQKEGILPADAGVAAIFERLERNRAEIRRVVLPDDAVNFDCRLLPAAAGDPTDGMLEVEAWATTRVPVIVAGFRFGNGREINAAPALAQEHAGWRRDGGTVVLPHDGRRLRLRFPVDGRLSRLNDIEDLKAALRNQAKDGSVKVELFVRHRVLAAAQVTEEPLPIRRAEPGGAGGARPQPPSLRAALEQHECLAYDIELDRLFVRPGTWTIQGDLVVPDGYDLLIGGGTTLRFAPDAVLLSGSPLVLRGLAEHPVVLEAADAATGWGGLVVLETTRRSQLEHVVVRDANAITRGAWQTLGGVNFYRAPVDMVGVRIERARGEDALNIISADMSLTGCTFDGGFSDLFDGDFVTGTVRDCSFARSGEDALDFSGSRVTIEGCRFADIGDKALSIGEATHATIRDCTVRGASIGLAAKDASQIDAEGLDCTGIEHFVVTAYVKKTEFGASTAIVRRLTPAPDAAKVLVQEGCRVEIDGRAIAGRAVDVKRLYDDKILGK